jgi:hypothetical protein
VPAVQHRHEHGQQDQARRRHGPQRQQRLLAVAGGHDAVAGPAQHGGEARAGDLVVLDDQDRGAGLAG